MQRLSFPIAVALTSLALVATIGIVGALTVRSALANGLWGVGPPWAGGGFGHMGGPPWAGRAGDGYVGGAPFDLPPELRGLADLPASERFGHFAGIQIALTDKDNRPFTIAVTPGTATAVGADRLTIAANDGTSRTFALNDRTVVRGRPAAGTPTPGSSAIATGESVVVVTLGSDPAARLVFHGPRDGFPGSGSGGPRGWWR